MRLTLAVKFIGFLLGLGILIVSYSIYQMVAG